MFKVFGRAVCTSASFWWPRVPSDDPEDTMYYGGFYFTENVMYDFNNGRSRQRIMIDVGGEEESEAFHVRK